MAMLGVGIVFGLVIGKAEEQRIGRGPFGADAIGEDVLVVMLGAGEQVLAVAVALVVGDCAADLERVAQRHGAGHDRVELAVGANIDLGFQVRLVIHLGGDILDRAANRVAAIERALGPAQDFDPFNVENVQDRALRTGDIDVVDIETDTGLEAPERILLADAANEGDQRGVGTAGHFDCGVRGRTLDGGDVDGAGSFQLVGTEGRHGQRHIDQVFFAALRGDSDPAQRAGLFRGLIRVLCLRSILARGQRKRRHETESQRIHFVISQFFLPRILSI